MNGDVVVVRAIPTDPAVRSSESLFLTETGNQGTPSRRLVEVGITHPPDHIAEAMGASTTLIVRRRLMSVNGIPVRIANSYFPAGAPESADLLADGFIKGGLQKLFERYGRRFGRSRETLTARPPSEQECQMLELAPRDPVVQIVRTSYDPDGKPVHSLETICAASRHLFVVTQLPGDCVF